VSEIKPKNSKNFFPKRMVKVVRISNKLLGPNNKLKVKSLTTKIFNRLVETTPIQM